MVKLELSVDDANWVLQSLQGEARVLRGCAAKEHRVGNDELSDWWDEVAERVGAVADRLEAALKLEEEEG